MIKISFYLICHLFCPHNFLFMFAFVSGLLSNTAIMLFMFMSLKAMTNNQPQVWIFGHKLLFFWDSRYYLHNCLLNEYFLFIMQFYFFILDVQLFSLIDHVYCDNKLLTYLLTLFYALTIFFTCKSMFDNCCTMNLID